MPSSHIIRIPRTDEEGAYVLGEVTPSGSKPLNVKFVATEGEEPYVVKLRHDRIGELRVSNSPCSPEEWEGILKALLLRGEPVEGIEAGAEASVGRSITITIRRRIAGISQRLGALTLNHKADEAIQLFDWCGAAAREREAFQETLAAERARVSDLEARVAELRAQLDELAQAKKAGEAEMLQKFCGLLNEKKLKIREQQRLLSTAQAGDPSKPAAARAAAQASRSEIEEEEGEEEKERRKPAASRRAKRKAPEDASGGGSSSDSDDGFEKVEAPAADEMDIDPRESPESEDRQTTDDGDGGAGDDDETASEPEEGSPARPSSPSLPPPPPTPPTRPQPSKTRQQRKPEPKGRAAPAGRAGKGRDVAIHPVRPLRRAAPKKASPAPADGSETESDDEL